MSELQNFSSYQDRDVSRPGGVVNTAFQTDDGSERVTVSLISLWNKISNHGPHD